MGARIRRARKWVAPRANEPEQHETFDRIRPTRRQLVITRALLVDEEAGGMFDGHVLQLVASAQLVRTDRRRDHGRRKRVAQMNQDEMRRELLTDHLTGLPNARALEERERQPKALVILDVDGLKWFNDELGHEAGDQLLRAVAQTLTWAGVESYRVHGDEFYLVFSQRGDITATMADVAERLRQTAFGVRDTLGQARVFHGACFSYGIGNDVEGATRAMHWQKVQREQLGFRNGARGGRPPSIQELNGDLCPLAKPWVRFTVVN